MFKVQTANDFGITFVWLIQVASKFSVMLNQTLEFKLEIFRMPITRQVMIQQCLARS